jgi:ABC-type branched-subunit amino acid transport system substrate-binding protein
MVPAAGAVAGLALVPAACSSSSSSAGPPPPAEAASPDVVIGFSDALSGGLKGVGIPLADVARVAEQQVNQVGILGGRHIHVEIADDASDPAEGAGDVADHFIGEGVSAVIGPLSSPQCQSVFQAYGAKGIVEISPTATSAIFRDHGVDSSFFFRTAPSDDRQGIALAQLVYAGVSGSTTADAGAPEAGVDGGAPDGGDPPEAGAAPLVGGGCRYAYVVHGKDDYGTRLKDSFAKTFLAMSSSAHVIGTTGVDTSLVPTYVPVADAVKSLRAVTSKHVGANRVCLVLIVYPDVGAQFLRDLRTETKSPAGTPLPFPVFGTDGEFDSAFIPDGETMVNDPTSDNVTEAVLGTTPQADPNATAYQTFVTLYRNSFPGGSVPAYGANLFDAIMVLALAMDAAGTATDGAAIRDALYQVTDPQNATAVGPAGFVDAEASLHKGIKVKYVGASGPLIFGDDGTNKARGDVAEDYAVWRVDRQPDHTFAFDTIARIKWDTLQ